MLAPTEETAFQSFLLSYKALYNAGWEAVLIYPLARSSVIKLLFVRGCNHQLPWHVPWLIVHVLPQHPAPSRTKHSPATLNSGEKMAENRVPLSNSLWSESCFAFLSVQPKWRKSIPKTPLLPSSASSQPPRSREEVVPKGAPAAHRGGRGKEGEPSLSSGLLDG